jgi:2-C-methyl-D-erythritol 2,4-cyclodiphosphate synthase
MGFPYRIGFGFDVHQLSEGYDLWLGGHLIPHEKGAVGHSDADVLLHAICDALLGAAALGDIGVHFPDTSNEFKGIDSKILLQRTVDLVHKSGYRIGNVDATLALQRPKIKPHIPAMQQTIAGILGIEVQDVSIKATTTEKLGYVGTEQGVNAYAVALIYTPNA